MIFGAQPARDCLGALLAHGLLLDGRRYPKGSLVDAALIASAQAAGIEQLWIARPEAGDVLEEDAAVRLAGVLATAGAAPRAPVHGRVNVYATGGGLLVVDAGAVSRVNGLSEDIAVSTLPPLTPVAPGELVATVKIIPYALPGAILAAAEQAAAGAVGIRPWQAGLSAILLQTQQAETPAKLLEKTATVTRDRLTALGISMAEPPHVPHTVADLAAALRSIPPADLLLVAGATATSDRRDVVPAAIVAAGGQVARVGMPVDPGNLLVFGHLNASGARVPVIGLPGCARSSKRNGFDLLLERLAAGLPVDAGVIAGMGVGGLLEESGQPVPWGWTGSQTGSQTG